jgi:hypothetical protein
MLLVQGCALPTPFKTTHSAVYRGKVTDAETQKPILNARVALIGRQNLTETAKTDANGEFEVGPLSCWRWFGVNWPLAEGRMCEHSNDGTVELILEISQDEYDLANVFVPHRNGGRLESIEVIKLKRKVSNRW